MVNFTIGEEKGLSGDALSERKERKEMSVLTTLRKKQPGLELQHAQRGRKRWLLIIQTSGKRKSLGFNATSKDVPAYHFLGRKASQTFRRHEVRRRGM